jgi:hypothetical protein
MQDHGPSAPQDSPLDSKYPRGKAITVYFNLRDPSISCLEPGPNWFILILGSLLSLLFLGAGFFLTRDGMLALARSQEQRIDTEGRIEDKGEKAT